MKNLIANSIWIRRLSTQLYYKSFYSNIYTQTNISKKYFILTQSSDYYCKIWIENQNNLSKKNIEEQDKNKYVFMEGSCSNKINCNDKFNIILEQLEKIKYQNEQNNKATQEKQDFLNKQIDK